MSGIAIISSLPVVTYGWWGEGNPLLFTVPLSSSPRCFSQGVVGWAITGSEIGSAAFWPLCADRLSGSGSMRLLTGSFLTISVLSA